MVTVCCLYCRGSGPSRTQEHFLPERLGHGHPFVLPVGSVCDKCQAWAAKDVDPAVWKEDIVVRQWLWRFAVPGKTGRPAVMQGGPGDRFDPVTGQAILGRDPRTDARVSRGQTFLCRAVHKMGLGAVMWSGHSDRALASEQATIATVVRQGGFRAYGRAIGRWIDPDVGLAVSVTGDLVGVQAYVVTWWIGLGLDALTPLETLRHIAGVHVVRGVGDVRHFGNATLASAEVGATGWRFLVREVKRDPEGWIDPSSLFQPEAPVQVLDPNSLAWRTPTGEADR